MSKVSSVLMVVIAFCAFALGCGSGDTATTSSSEWVTIPGRNVSLRLPASFEGGDPADPTVMAVLREMAESRSNPDERENLLEWLDTVKAGADRASSPSLMAWVAPDDGGPVTSVTVNWSPLQNLLVESHGDSSMQALVDAYMVGQTDWKVDSVKEREASVIVRYGEADPSAPAEYIVIKVVGDSVYTLRYTCPDESWNAWYETFKESAQTFDLTL